MGSNLCNLLFVYLVTSLAQEVSAENFSRGSNVTIVFHHQLISNNDTYSLNIHIAGSSVPFYSWNRIDPEGLRPDQYGRINVKDYHDKRNVSIEINISNVKVVDEGSYVVTIVEGSLPQTVSSEYDRFIEVTYPPGEAECEVQTPALLGEHWLTVFCNATLGNDDHGNLVCLQNNIPRPYLQPVKHYGICMTATFWVDLKTELRCCSTDDGSTVDKDACNHFVHPGQETNVSPVSSTPITNSLSTSITPDTPSSQEEQDSSITKPVVGCWLLGVALVLVFTFTCICCKCRHGREKDDTDDQGQGSQGQGPDYPDPFDESLPSWACSTDQPVKIRGRKGTKSPPITIQRLFQRNKDKYPTMVALAFGKLMKGDKQEGWTYTKYWEDCRKVAKALIQLGIQKHQTVGICGRNSPEWVLSYMGTIMARCVAVGLSTEFDNDGFWQVIDDCKPEVIVMEDTVGNRVFVEGRGTREYPKHFVFYNARQQLQDPSFYSWSGFIDLGHEVPDGVLDKIIDAQTPNECCSITYTTDPSGDLKGCMISHDNLTWLSQHCASSLNILGTKGRFASYLPLHHIAFQLIDIMIPLTSAGTTYFTRNLETATVVDEDAEEMVTIKMDVETAKVGQSNETEDEAMSGLRGRQGRRRKGRQRVDDLTAFFKLVRPTMLLFTPDVLDEVKEDITKMEKTFPSVRQRIVNWAKRIGIQGNMNISK